MPHYIRGKYPPDWHEIARRVKEKAGWRCERCHHPAEGPWKMGAEAREMLRRRAAYEFEQAPIPGRALCDALCQHPRDGKQRMLTVDHLDGNKTNCALWNLAALCQSCHLKVQGRGRMEQVWAFEHTEWMHPHVEGMLAAQARGEWP